MANSTEIPPDTIEVSLPSVEEITLVDGMVAEAVFPDQPAMNIDIEWLEPEQITA